MNATKIYPLAYDSAVNPPSYDSQPIPTITAPTTLQSFQPPQDNPPNPFILQANNYPQPIQYENNYSNQNNGHYPQPTQYEHNFPNQYGNNHPNSCEINNYPNNCGINNYPNPPVQPPSVIVGNQSEPSVVFSILNAVFFFPIFFLWIPAVHYSFKARSYFQRQQYAAADRCRRNANMLNIACLITGK